VRKCFETTNSNKSPTSCKFSLVYYLTFIYGSTCFGRPYAHHQKSNNCSGSLWFYLPIVVIAVLLDVVGPVGRLARPRPTALLSPRSNGKPEAATAVVELLLMGMWMPETRWAVSKRQVLRSCCIWLVDSAERHIPCLYLSLRQIFSNSSSEKWGSLCNHTQS
jgi:hypothetical protein